MGQDAADHVALKVLPEAAAQPPSSPRPLLVWNQSETPIFLGGVCRFCRDFNFTASQLSKLPSQAGYLNLSPALPSAAGLLRLDGISSLQPTALGCWSGTKPSPSFSDKEKGTWQTENGRGTLAPGVPRLASAAASHHTLPLQGTTPTPQQLQGPDHSLGSVNSG